MSSNGKADPAASGGGAAPVDAAVFLLLGRSS